MSVIELHEYESPYEPTLEAERYTLGCMILSPAAIRWFRCHGSREWFMSESHGKILDAILKADDLGAKLSSATFGVNMVAVNETLGVDSESVGGQDYLMQLIEAVASPSEMPFYASVVRSHWIRRELDKRVKSLKAKLNSKVAAGDVNEILVEASDLTKGLNGSMEPEIGSAAELNLDDSEVRGLSTSFKCMDRLCTYRGFPVGLNILLAGTNVGKTRLAVQMMAHHVDKFSDHHAVFVSLEMSKLQIVQAHVSQQTGMSRYPRKPRVESLFVEDLEEALKDYEAKKQSYDTEAAKLLNSDLDIWDPGPSDHTIERICAKLESAHMRKPINSIWLDYIQLVGVNNPKEYGYNKTQILEHVANSLKAFAMKLGCPIICLSQPADKTVKSPFYLECMHCKTIESASEMLIGIIRDKATNESQACIKKNRFGFTAMLDGMAFDLKYGKWVEGSA